MTEDFQISILAYFEEAARTYPDIEPAFAPLAEGLVRYAHLKPKERVIDLGTGSGLVARAAARRCRFVCAVDFSRQMLTVARAHRTPCIFQGDMHRLPVCDSAFDVALASFAFNSTDPARTLREAGRILRPGGRLVLQEWGTSDPLNDLLADTVNAYAVEDPPPELAALRKADRQHYP